jgi:RNA polymerase sigma-70 factor (ECF subfamily)
MPDQPVDPDRTRAAAERVARDSYGKILAFLATRWRDVTLAEDALAEAFASALERWPEDGVPASPERWLATVAHRKLLDHARHTRFRTQPEVLATLSRLENAEEPSPFPDNRLRLMLVCAHPAIDVAVRPALVLQTVLGLDVKTIAPAFLLPADTLNKRLVRAKSKIRQARIPFEDPEPADLAERIEALLEALYAGYFLGREGTLAEGDERDELRDESVSVLRLIAANLPDNAEVLGLLALVLFCEARRGAQSTADGEFVPLLEQDTTRWDPSVLREAYETLGRAAHLGREGPFQIEAAIQAAHCYRARAGVVPWSEIVGLYSRLLESHPTIGAAVGMAVASAHADDSPSRGLEILLAIDARRVANYQPWWVALAHLHKMAGREDEAKRALQRAIGLTTNPRIRRFLARRG